MSNFEANKYAVLMETSDEECESWYYFLTPLWMRPIQQICLMASAALTAPLSNARREQLYLMML